MPRGDGTGPWGFGPGTGRAAGYCAGYPVPGYANPIPGYRRWRRFGYFPGWSYGRPYVDEKAFLEEQVVFLKEQLSLLERRLDDINKFAK